MKWWQGFLVGILALAALAWFTEIWETEGNDAGFTPSSQEEKQVEAPKPAPLPNVDDKMSEPDSPGILASLEEYRAAMEHERLEKCYAQINAKSDSDRRFRGILSRSVASTTPAWFINREPPDMKPPPTASANFVTGLAHAGFLQDGNDGPKEKNLDEALEFLEQAHKMDPTNSAPLIFAALTAKEMGDEEKFKQLWAELDRTDHFDSYLKKMINETYQNVNSPDDLIQATSIIAGMPIPDYISMKKQLKVTPSPAVARQMLKDGLNPKNTKEFGDWIALEYAIGHDLLPEEEKEKYPNYKKMFGMKRDRDPDIFDQITTELEKNCDPETLWPMVYELKSLRSAL